MKDKITTGYSELQILFKELGIKFKDSGPAESNLGKEVSIIIIADEYGDGSVWLNFKIDSEGNETFLSQVGWS